MTCLSERELTEFALGDAAEDRRRHVEGCAACAGRTRAITRDLARLRTVLAEPPPVFRPTHTFGTRWTAVAAAAAIVLAVALGRHTSTPPAVADDGTLALLDELADAMADGTSFETDATSTSSTRSTCAWGDPLLGVGCEGTERSRS